MDRRELVTHSLAAGAALLAASSLPLAGNALAATEGVWAKVLDSTAKCITVGLSCQSHCQKELGKGNKDMAECLTSVSDMLVACEALQKLAASGSKHAKAFAANCATVCAECAKTCEKHAKHMEICKDCSTACQDCEKACTAAA